MNDHSNRRFDPTEIDIPTEFWPQVIEMLSLTVATVMDLKTTIWQSQWNQLINFYQPHELYDELVPVLDEYIDLFTAWIAALNGQAIKTKRTGAKQSALLECPLNMMNIKKHVSALADRLAPYAKSLRSSIDSTSKLGNPQTGNLPPEGSQIIAGRLWFQDVHLQARKVSLGDETAASRKEKRVRKSQLRHAISKGLIKSQNSQSSDAQEYYLPISVLRLPAAWT